MKHFWISIFVIFLGGCGGEFTETLTTYTTTQTSNVVESSSVSPQVTEKPDLSVVDTSTELHIERLCYDTKDDGVLPYWSCLTEELNKVKNISQPDLDVVDTSTELHIERLCYDTKDDGVVPYWNCLRKELSKIDNSTQPDLSVVDTSTELHIERLCYDTKDDGVLPYWSCLRKELNKIGVTPPEIPISTKQTVQSTSTTTQETQSTVKEPVDEETVLTSKPDMSGLNELDTLITETKCEFYKRFGVQSYWRCLDEQINESKTVDFRIIETLRDEVDEETRDIILSYCEGFVRFGIESYYRCLYDEVESIGVK